MPFDSAGTYSLVSTYAATPSTPIKSEEQHNTVLEDIETALNAMVLANGKRSMTGKLTLSGNATAALHAVPLQQVEALFTAIEDVSTPFYSFLPSGFAIATDDVTPYVHAAAAYSSTSGRAITFDGGNYKVKTPILIDEANVRFHFNGTTFTLDATAAMVQTLYTGFSGQIGILVTGTDGCYSGALKLVGTGTLGTTTLAAIVFYKSHRTIFPADIFASSVSAGRFALWCISAKFGDLYGVSIWGLQTFGPGTQGDLCVSIGCQFCYFGDVVGNYVNKAARYCSVALDDVGAKVANLDCHYGNVTVVSNPGSTESSGLSIRNASGCTFGVVQTSSCVIGVNLQQYNSDAGFVVNSNKIAGIIARNCPGVNSSAFRAIGDTTQEIGTNRIGFVFGINVQGYAIYNLYAKHTIIENVIVDAANSLFYFGNGMIEGGEWTARNITGQSYYDNGAVFRLDAVRFHTGLASAVPAIQKLNATANDGEIGIIEYKQNGVGTNPTMLLFDDVSTCRQVRVNNTSGGTATTSLRYGAANLLRARGGSYYKQFALSAAAGILAGNQNIQDLSWTGVALGDEVTVCLHASPGAFTSDTFVIGADLIRTIWSNFTNATQSFSAVDATVWVKLQ